MNHARAMCCLQRIGDLHCHVDCIRQRKWSLLKRRAERLAFDELHHDAWSTTHEEEVCHLHDSAVTNAVCESGFDEGAADSRWIVGETTTKDLDGHAASNALVLRKIDAAHPTLGEQAHDPVGTEDCSLDERSVLRVCGPHARRESVDGCEVENHPGKFGTSSCSRNR